MMSGEAASPAATGAEEAAAEAASDHRFGALQRLYGAPGAARIRRAHVAVVGLGGVGSWAAEALARSGVAQLTLIDLDHVSESNINRQIQALSDTLGQSKVQAMRERIARIHPACQVHCVEDFAGPDNWPALLASPVDALIDACDQVRAKLALAVWAQAAGVVHVSAGAAGGKRQAHQVDIDDLARASHDPLLARLRQRWRKLHPAARDGQKTGVTTVFSREAVAPPEPSCGIDADGDGGGGKGDGSLNCHGYGSVVTVTATFGHCAAGWVLEQLVLRPANTRT